MEATAPVAAVAIIGPAALFSNPRANIARVRDMDSFAAAVTCPVWLGFFPCSHRNARLAFLSSSPFHPHNQTQSHILWSVVGEGRPIFR